MKVLFDANPMVAGQKSGVGYYTYRLIDSLAKNHPEVEFVGHYFNFLGRKSPALPQSKNLRYKQSRLVPGKILAMTRRLGFQLPFELFIKSRGDVCLFPNFVALPTLFPSKKVVVIHDLCFVDHPEYLQPANMSFLRSFVPRSLASTSAVFTVSDSTKKSVINHYNVPEDKILVTPIPPPAPEKSDGRRPKTLGDISKYILFMSTLEPRKNFIGLVRAYASLTQDIKDTYALVLAGKPGWATDDSMKEIEQIQKAGAQIILTGYVADEEQTFLYKNASALIMPSYYEGFGMPLLEAMSYRLPVVASDIPVFHEVAGDAALYFDPNSIDSIADAIQKLIKDDNLRQDMVRNGIKHLEKYSWKEVADKVMEEFSTLTEKGGQ